MATEYTQTYYPDKNKHKMEKRYRIKEEYKKLVNEWMRDLEYIHDGRTHSRWSYIGENGTTTYIYDLSDEVFEEIEPEKEERIKVEIYDCYVDGDLIRSKGHVNFASETKPRRRALFVPNDNPTEEQRLICEQALDGELVSVSKILDHCKWLKGGQGVDVNHQLNNLLSYIQLDLLGNDDYEPSVEEKKVALNKIRFEATTAMIDGAEPHYTKPQVIELVADWVGKESTRSLLSDKLYGITHLFNSFKGFINSK